MTSVAVLGAGLAGLGAATRFKAEGHAATVYDRRDHIGGHASTVVYDGGWVFDEGPHISFTKVTRMQELFAANVDGRYEAFKSDVNNYWQGQWIKHPAQVNLHGLPTDLLVTILDEMVRAQFAEAATIGNYADWLVASFGRTFAETFPMQYGRKYHTTEASNMTTDWLGPRLYRPELKEVLRGAVTAATPDVHYISDFRYPTQGGFVSFLTPFAAGLDLRLSHDVSGIDASARVLRFADGGTAGYDVLVSSLPLPELIPRIDGAPAAVVEAAATLACSTCVIVNIGLDRADISDYHWTYFYDDDYSFSRLSFPHMFSPHNVPAGKGSIQAEVYFSKKYKPLQQDPQSYVDVVVRDLTRCGLMREGEPVAFSSVIYAPYANVIFNLDRPAALATVKAYLDEIGIQTCGRYGDWSYAWTDESFMSGEAAATRALDVQGAQHG